MNTFIVSLIIGVIIFLLYIIFMWKQNPDDSDKILYICKECGDMDCVCHRASDDEEKRS